MTSNGFFLGKHWLFSFSLAWVMHLDAFVVVVVVVVVEASSPFKVIER